MRNADGCFGFTIFVAFWLILFISVFVLSAISVSFYVQPYIRACDKASINIPLEHHWYINGGCFVRVESEVWVSIDTYLWIEKKKDGVK